MAASQSSSLPSVVLKLSVEYPLENFPFPERRIPLRLGESGVAVGRASKKDKSIKSAISNAFFDSPVMSRDHAKFWADDSSKVFVKDTGSMHGTYLNGQQLPRNQVRHIRSRDRIQFGAAINRGSEIFDACTVSVGLESGSGSSGDHRSSRLPSVIRVPDDEMDNDNDSGSDSVAEVARVLKNNIFKNAFPAPFTSRKRDLDVIDLTQDADNASTPSLSASSSPAQASSPPTGRAALPKQEMSTKMPGTYEEPEKSAEMPGAFDKPDKETRLVRSQESATPAAASSSTSASADGAEPLAAAAAGAAAAKAAAAATADAGAQVGHPDMSGDCMMVDGSANENRFDYFDDDDEVAHDPPKEPRAAALPVAAVDSAENSAVDPSDMSVMAGSEDESASQAGGDEEEHAVHNSEHDLMDFIDLSDDEADGQITDDDDDEGERDEMSDGDEENTNMETTSDDELGAEIDHDLDQELGAVSPRLPPLRVKNGPDSLLGMGLMTLTDFSTLEKREGKADGRVGAGDILMGGGDTLNADVTETRTSRAIDDSVLKSLISIRDRLDTPWDHMFDTPKLTDRPKAHSPFDTAEADAPKVARFDAPVIGASAAKVDASVDAAKDATSEVDSSKFYTPGVSMNDPGKASGTGPWQRIPSQPLRLPGIDSMTRHGKEPTNLLRAWSAVPICPGNEADHPVSETLGNKMANVACWAERVEESRIVIGRPARDSCTKPTHFDNLGGSERPVSGSLIPRLAVPVHQNTVDNSVATGPKQPAERVFQAKLMALRPPALPVNKAPLWMPQWPVSSSLPPLNSLLSRPFDDGQFSSSPVDRQFSSSPVNRQSSASPVDRQPSASPVDRQPSASPVDRQQSASPVDRQSSASPVDRQSSSSPVIDRQSSASPVDHQLGMPVDARQPTLSAVRSPTTTRPGHAHVDPELVRKLAYIKAVMKQAREKMADLPPKTSAVKDAAGKEESHGSAGPATLTPSLPPNACEDSSCSVPTPKCPTPPPPSLKRKADEISDVSAAELKGEAEKADAQPGAAETAAQAHVKDPNQAEQPKLKRLRRIIGLFSCGVVGGSVLTGAALFSALSVTAPNL